ncbi:MAG: ABC transporter substrate-binding protein [Desulfobacterales bacterium]|jgi:branched-chain amino acid transport system substrate-binding protein
MKAAFRFLGVLIIIGLIIPGGVLAEKEIKIGAIYPLSGGAAAAGRELRAGAELAAEIANNVMGDINMSMAQNSGIKSLGGAKIKIIFKDHEGNPTLGADLAKKLILDDKVDGLLGCYHSSVTKTVSAVAEQQGVPMINGTSTSPALTQRGFKWFWRTTPHDVWFTKDLFELLKGLSGGKVKGVGAVPQKDLMNIASACENSEWGSFVSELISEYAKEYGFNLRKSLLYSAKAPDLSSEARSLKASRADVLLFASYTSDAILMIKTLKAQKVSPKVIWGQDAGFEKPEFRSTLGDSIEGILTRTVFLPQVVQLKEVAGQVNKLYKAKTKNDLGGASARAFTGLQTWVYVLEKAGSTNPADIQRAANTIQIPGKELVVPWAGIKFTTSGKEIGQNIQGSGLIGQYQKGPDGEIGLEIVYPFDVASADMIYPFPKF